MEFYEVLILQFFNLNLEDLDLKIVCHRFVNTIINKVKLFELIAIPELA